MAEFQTPPFKVSKAIWSSFYRAQMSGHMNMMGHPYVVYFLEEGWYQAAFDHFETQGKSEDLVIT